MKTFILGAIASAAVAYHHGFPDDSSFHAGIHATASITGSCADAKANADKIIKDNIDTGSEYKG